MGRDRFVLSAGHSSLTLYIQLYLGGFGLALDDLKSLRVWGSRTPGHPEHGHTAGVETTTGPLGQGVANAVGMAMAARRERGLLDPDAPAGESPFDHQIYVIASDGDLEEGVSSEASSLAGHQQLGNLTLIYDDNKISIEDDTAIAFSEDVSARYRAYGWHVQDVDWTNGGTEYAEDVDALWKALRKARSVTDRPSFINLRTIIAWPAPNAQNTGKAHGSALGDDEVKATKKVLGVDPERTFDVADDVLEHTRGLLERGLAAAGRLAGGLRRLVEPLPQASGASRPDAAPAPSPTGGPTPCRRSTPTRRASPRGRPPARCSPRSCRCCPSSGAARPTSPRATTPRPRASRRSCRPSTRRRSSRATRTAACCTSASASTRWARS